MSNAFDMVRKIRYLPGLQLSASLDPTQVPKRVKTAAQKMLRAGILTSGYRSKSRMLAEQMLASAYRDAPVAHNSWGVFITDVAILTKEARAQIVELIEAAKLLEHATAPSGNTEYINSRYGRMVSEAKKIGLGRLYLTMYKPEIHVQIAEIVAACRTPLMVEIHNELANKLDTTDIIPITL